MATNPGDPATDAAPVNLKRHPRGLYVLFFTEMWERMAYYGMRSLLVLYMTQHLFLEGQREHVLGYGAIKSGLEALFGPLAIQPLASQIYGLYTGLVWFTPFFGGILADRVLGQRKSVVIGGVIMAAGEFFLFSEATFFVGLLLLILGNGCFKPNISTQVGTLYPEGDPRRDRAFTIFYMGINVGALLSPLISGTLGQTVGWRWGFFAAGVGMLLGLVIYLFGQRHLAPDLVSRVRAGEVKHAPMTRDDWRRVSALALLFLVNIVFWAIYEQQGNTMQLWADASTEWPTILGFTIPSTWFQSFNPAMIILLAPVVSAFWSWQNRRGREPHSVVKMALGCLVIGISYVVMIAAARVVGVGKGNMMWLAGATLLATIGELYVSPVGLSLVTKVAPPQIVSMMMGLWFLSTAIGDYLTGVLGMFWEKMPKDSFFVMLTLLGIGAGIAMWMLAKPVKKVIGTV